VLAPPKKQFVILSKAKDLQLFFAWLIFGGAKRSGAESLP
jgi:hypothetical protein